MNTLTPAARSTWLQRLLMLQQRIASGVSRSRAEGRLWQAARGDHRVMAECLQAQKRDQDDAAGPGQAWGRFPEQLPDGRGQATHLRHG